MVSLVLWIFYHQMTAPSTGFQLKCFTREGEGVWGFFDLYSSNIESMDECECQTSCTFSFLIFVTVLSPDFDVRTAPEVILIASKMWRGYCWRWNHYVIIVYNSNNVRWNVLACWTRVQKCHFEKCRGGLEGFVSEWPDPFDYIFQTLESMLSKKLLNA